MLWRAIEASRYAINLGSPCMGARAVSRCGVSKFASTPSALKPDMPVVQEGWRGENLIASLQGMC